MKHQLPHAASPLEPISWWQSRGKLDPLKTASFWLIPFCLWPVVIVGLVNGDEFLLDLFSPLANVVFVYGAYSQFKELQDPSPETAFDYAMNIFVFLSHLSVVLLFWQRPRSLAGGGVAAGVLSAASLFYLFGLVQWPYHPTPIETLVLVGSLVIVELV